MSIRLGTLTGLGFALVLAAVPAQAQIAFGLAAGATTPSGSLNDRQDLGYNGLATLQLGMPVLPFQLRQRGLSRILWCNI